MAMIALALVACEGKPAPSGGPGGASGTSSPTPAAILDAAAAVTVDAALPAGPPAPPPAVDCKGRKKPVGVLYAGNPLYRGDDHPSPAGVGFRADPPLAWRDVVIAGGHVFTDVGQEIWAGTPETTMRRIAGEHQPGKVLFRDGPCRTARLAYTDGIAALPDGSLVVADVNANALVRITDPLGADCAVHYYAGTSAAIDGVVATVLEHAGKSDGTGAAAQFELPFKPVVDAGGTVYVLDEGNDSIRKVVADGAAGTVTTVPFSLPGVEWNDLAMRGDTLIAVGQASGADSIVVEIDPDTGAHEVLIRGSGDRFPPTDPMRSPLISAVASDGKRVFVAGSGRIWEVTAKGRAVHLAGGFSPNDLVDYPRDHYDPAAEHRATQLQLKHSIADLRSAQFLTYDAGSLYWSARAYAGYVVRITCLDGAGS
jgi:hypothetical protein